ncbi:MAG: hypothetical protein D8H92_05750 [Campylobacter sp.]|nr:MAG: hypothetical protein D8H92_05750 [Campylobacter sp.]
MCCAPSDALPIYRAAAAARSFSTPLCYRSRRGLKFYLGAVFLADHFAFKFYQLKFLYRTAIAHCRPTSELLVAP